MGYKFVSGIYLSHLHFFDPTSILQEKYNKLVQLYNLFYRRDIRTHPGYISCCIFLMQNISGSIKQYFISTNSSSSCLQGQAKVATWTASLGFLLMLAINFKIDIIIWRFYIVLATTQFLVR